MPRLNQSQIGKLVYYLEKNRSELEGSPIKDVAAKASSDIGVEISEAQVENLDESIELPLVTPVKKPRSSKNDIILDSLNVIHESLARIDKKINKVIG